MTIHAEATIMVRTRTDAGWSTWTPSLDMDPINIPDLGAWTTDPFNEAVYNLVDAIIAADSMNASPNMETTLAWSESGRVVTAVCPVCDSIFPVAEGAPGDELNEGYDAVFCGCDPADMNDDNI